MHIAVIHGPNLNMLGIREPQTYGTMTIADINAMIATKASELGISTQCFQSNHEGELIDFIHRQHGTADAIIINPGGLTHTSVALRDALLSVSIPYVEVHLSNVYSREPFRHHSYLSDKAKAVISGAGHRGYLYALDALSATQSS
ncbi:3-dehydroquinate dehydratase, type II [Desulfurispirillum indicum S5]|uniref:3-dehydroquinate dehydratase n=1 Tax=Desulfurispirillum indicum (strain ATCC BAA-1389 / DSM 22839 / S5) TaxID=653733 RepID=E6W1L4_DESIS|nr:type II 3-dehydroquinate dehydratase [Desulfurispirillum indicum]ADU66563.1 3-dehydroquinate dehydratase, type II [Desulfurispirillum indicum S5]